MPIEYCKSMHSNEKRNEEILREKEKQKQKALFVNKEKKNIWKNKITKKDFQSFHFIYLFFNCQSDNFFFFVGSGVLLNFDW